MWSPALQKGEPRKFRPKRRGSSKIFMWKCGSSKIFTKKGFLNIKLFFYTNILYKMIFQAYFIFWPRGSMIISTRFFTVTHTHTHTLNKWGTLTNLAICFLNENHTKLNMFRSGEGPSIHWNIFFQKSLRILWENTMNNMTGTCAISA